MSERYEVALSCSLRDDTPEWVMAALRWHLGMDADFPEGLHGQDEYLHPLLVPDNYANRRIPGGDIVSLRREVQEFTSSGERYEWELFARKGWIDDSMVYLRGLLDLLAPHIAQPGYGGHFRHISGTEVTFFDFSDGAYEPIKIWGVDPR